MKHRTYIHKLTGEYSTLEDCGDGKLCWYSCLTPTLLPETHTIDGLRQHLELHGQVIDFTDYKLVECQVTIIKDVEG